MGQTATVTLRDGLRGSSFVSYDAMLYFDSIATLNAG